MSALTVLGITLIIIVGVFLPRTVASTLGGIMVASSFSNDCWWIFAPLTVLAIIIDMAAIAAISDQ